MRGAFEDVIGKRIKGVIIKESSRQPQSQIFLLFADNTSFEIYGDTMRGASGIDRLCSLEAIKKYMASPDRQITFEKVDESIVDRDLPKRRNLSMKIREHKTIILLLLMALVGLIWLLQGYYRISQFTERKTSHIVTPNIDRDSQIDVGYIYQMRVTNSLWDGKKKIMWWIKIPATDKIYSCSWEDGFNDFNKNDGVILVHKRKEYDNVDWSGYIRGLHGDKKGKTTLVWALDVDDLYYAD